MKMRQGLALVLAMGLGSAAYLHAADTPGDAPQEKKPAAKAGVKTPRLTQPWSKMGSLTLEQKQQIAAIHKQSIADKKKIDEKEEADILALLSPEQKAEVEKVKEEGTAAAKKKTADTPATQPEGGM